jgi:hypothetical protein
MTDGTEKEPRIEDTIRNAADNGWEFFEHPADHKALDARRLAEQSRIQRLAAIAATMMTIPEFVELYDYLHDMTLRRAAWVAQLGLPMDHAYGYGTFREGQNSIVFILGKLIAEGRKMQPPKGRDP